LISGLLHSSYSSVVSGMPGFDVDHLLGGADNVSRVWNSFLASRIALNYNERVDYASQDSFVPELFSTHEDSAHHPSGRQGRNQCL
jgi:hypothetical protein